MAVVITGGVGSRGVKELSQRTASGFNYPLTVSGTATGHSYNGIRLRVVNASDDSPVVEWFTPDASSLTSTGWVVTVGSVIPQGGWYKWQVRLMNGATAILTQDDFTNTFGVGPLFLLAGQSNASGWWETEDSPAAIDAKAAFWQGGSWKDLASTTSGDGVHKFLNDIQADVTAEDGDIPVGVVGIAVGASGLTERGDWQDVGAWMGDIGGSGLQTYLSDTLYEATGAYRAEAILWHQGEAEGTASLYTPYYEINPGEYRGALRGLRDLFSDIVEHPGTGSIPMVVGSAGHFFSLAGVLGCGGLLSSYPVVLDDAQQAFSGDGTVGWVTTSDLPLETSGSYYGLHHTAAGYETMAARYADAVAGVLGWSGTHGTGGPKIIRGYIGTEASPFDRTKITLFCEHDQGSSFTLGEGDSKAAFEVRDAYGALAVTGVSSTTENSFPVLVLTVERDTSATESTGDDHEFSAPPMIWGNHVLVRYMAWPHIEPEYAIVDNSATTLPLRPTFGAQSETELYRWSHTAIKAWKPRGYSLSPATPTTIYALVTSVTNLGSNQEITVSAPDSWTNLVASGTRIPRPGEVCVFNADATGAIGEHRGSCVIRKVLTYTDDTTAFTLQLVDDMTSFAPQVGDHISVATAPWLSSGIMAYARCEEAFGESW